MSLRIVHVAPRNFLPLGDGGRVKAAALASALASCGELHVVDIDRHPYEGIGEPWGEELPLPFGGTARFYLGTALAPPQRDSALSSWHRLRAGLARRSRHWRNPRARALVDRLAPDIVVGDDISCLEVAAASKTPRRIQHLHNIESQLQFERARATGRAKLLRQAQRYQRQERELLPQFDQVWAVSDGDQAYFRDLGVRQVRLMPNVVPMSAFDPDPRPGPPGVALFFGSLGWEPNATAVEDLCAMAERLRARGLVWRVGGKGASAALQERMRAAPGLEYLGFVPSLLDAARQAAAVLVPITWGGGTKVKTIEAMALGKPLVTTPEGAEGLRLVDGEHALIRPLGPGFDAAVLEVLDEPARYADMGRRAQALALDQFSQRALDRRVREALDPARG